LARGSSARTGTRIAQAGRAPERCPGSRCRTAPSCLTASSRWPACSSIVARCRRRGTSSGHRLDRLAQAIQPRGVRVPCIRPVRLRVASASSRCSPYRVSGRRVRPQAPQLGHAEPEARPAAAAAAAARRRARCRDRRRSRPLNQPPRPSQGERAGHRERLTGGHVGGDLPARTACRTAPWSRPTAAARWPLAALITQVPGDQGPGPPGHLPPRRGRRLGRPKAGLAQRSARPGRAASRIRSPARRAGPAATGGPPSPGRAARPARAGRAGRERRLVHAADDHLGLEGRPPRSTPSRAGEAEASTILVTPPEP